MIQKIYFDMDGVLADFDGGVSKLCEMSPIKQGEGRSKAEDDLMWERIRKIPHFYDKLDPMPGALELFGELYEKYGNKCEILTGIPKPKRGITTAGEDKISWVHRLLSTDIKVNIVYREEKKNYCTGEDCILIDDLETNIEEWKMYGGMGILYRGADDVRSRLVEKNIL